MLCISMGEACALYVSVALVCECGISVCDVCVYSMCMWVVCVWTGCGVWHVWVFGLQTSGLIVQEFYWKKIKNPTTYTSKAKHLKACKSAAHLKPPKTFNRRNAPVFTDLDLRDSPVLRSQKQGAAEEQTHRALETRSPASAERAAQNWHFRYH